MLFTEPCGIKPWVMLMSHCFIGCCVEGDRRCHALGYRTGTSYQTAFSARIQISSTFSAPLSKKRYNTFTDSPNAQLSNWLLNIKAKLINQTQMPDACTGVLVHAHTNKLKSEYLINSPRVWVHIFIQFICACAPVSFPRLWGTFTGVSSSLLSWQLDRHNKYIRQMQLRYLFKCSYCCGGVD